ncbi:MAG TPA: NosD domain-containing protein [Gemmatimonadales bacterium]|nr:NosD domain-containing protein [Gemmatimonadales bacterium]
MTLPRLLLPLLLATAPISGHTACVRPTKANTVVQGEVAICPGRYRIPDPDGKGVIVAGSPGTSVNLTGVTLESGDSVPADYRGAGVMASGVDRITITGGTIRGYQFGIRIDGGRGHVVAGADVSGSRTQTLRSTPERFDEADWLDIFHADSAEAYGAGVYLSGTVNATVRNIKAVQAQNGIMLRDASGTVIVDNDVSSNSGWGISLWHSSHGMIARNQAHHNVRCESPQYRRGCDSAGILLREASDSNIVADNDISFSGDGFFLSGQPPDVNPSTGNLVLRNDATGAWHNAFESTFSFGNRFLDNRADSSDYGFWLGYSTANVVEGNLVIGTRTAGIAIEHGQDNVIARNTIVGGQVGVRLFAPDTTARRSRGSEVDGNYLARLDRGVVLQRSERTRVRGNIFDGAADGLVVDSTSADASVRDNVFLRASRLFIVADHLDAGGNYWATANAAAARQQVRGNIQVDPWRPAREAGY